LKRPLILFFLIVFASSFSYGNDDNVPGKWWKHPKIAKELELTNDQVNRIEAIFSSYKPQMIELSDQLKKKEAERRAIIRNPNSNPQDAERLTDEIANIRGAMEGIRGRMSLQIMYVLTPQQRSKLEEIKSRYGKAHR
jgi:Spy/CpxP family protein refolding chaperone